MSGIAGIINFDGKPIAPGWIETMTSAMDYRGPEWAKYISCCVLLFHKVTLHCYPDATHRAKLPGWRRHHAIHRSKRQGAESEDRTV